MAGSLCGGSREETKEKELGVSCGKEGKASKHETFIFASVLAKRSWP